MKDSLLPGTGRGGGAVSAIHQRLKSWSGQRAHLQGSPSARVAQGKRCFFWKRGRVRKAHSQKSGFELCRWGVGTSPQPHQPWCRAGSRKTLISSSDRGKAKQALQGPQCNSTSSIHLPPLPSQEPPRATHVAAGWLRMQPRLPGGHPWAGLGNAFPRAVLSLSPVSGLKAQARVMASVPLPGAPADSPHQQPRDCGGAGVTIPGSGQGAKQIIRALSQPWNLLETR